MERIDISIIMDKKSVALARWESFGEVTENHYTDPIYGEIEPGKPVMFGGDNFIKNPNGVQAVAYVEYVTGIGYIASVNTLDASTGVTTWKYSMLKHAKRFNKVAAERVVSDFDKMAADVIEEKKKEDGLTASGIVKFTDMVKEKAEEDDILRRMLNR